MNTYKQDFLISSYDLNPRGEARFTSLANFFQEVAYQHASILGLGFQDMLQHQMIWVLSRLRVQVSRYPLWDENIRVETWPSGVDKLFALRQFRVSNMEGEELARAESAWLVLNSESHRLVRPGKVLDLMNIEVREERVFEEMPGKLDIPEKLEQSSKLRVSFSDLDINAHANNVKYMEWCIDALYSEKDSYPPILEMEINFNKEARHGDQITLFNSGDEKGSMSFLAKREQDDAEIIRARFLL